MTVAAEIRRHAATIERPPRWFRRVFHDQSDAAQRILWARQQEWLSEDQCIALLRELRLGD